jgi:predicted permease
MPVLRRLWFLLQRSRLDRELREEMQWHLDERTQGLVDEGLDEAVARDAALRSFGNPLHQREESRDWWGFAWLDRLAQDVRHSARSLAREPLLAAIAVVSLGATIAAACAVFTLANQTLFASLPVPRASELAVLRWVSGPTCPYESLDGWSTGDDRQNSSSSLPIAAFQAARERAGTRAEVFAFADMYQASVTVNGESEVASGQLVSGNYFSALGIRPAAGRFITPSDDRIDAEEAVTVISHAFWRRRFGGRTDVVGSRIQVNAVPVTIVGIGPAGFEGTRQVGETSDVSVPLMLRERFVRRSDGAPGQVAEDQLRPFDPRYWWVIVMARVRSGAGGPGLQHDVEAGVRSVVSATRGGEGRGESFSVFLDPGRRGQPEGRGELVEPLAIMALIVAAVIVIACANLATLMLARGAARDHETAVRQALGASRARLVVASLTESVVIGLAGGLVGLAGARWASARLLPALGLGQDSAIAATTGVPVLGFALGVSVAASLLFGLLPAWRGTDTRAADAMKHGAGRVAGPAPRQRMARAVLVVQVAVSLVVLGAASLLVGTLRNLERTRPGFDASNVLLFRVDPSLNGYDLAARRRAFGAILEGVRALPGVRSASFSQHALLSGSSSTSMVQSADGAALKRPLATYRVIVDEQFFRTMGIAILAGSTRFGGALDTSMVRPAVVSREFATQAFGTPNAVGHRFRFSNRADKPVYEVVGVAADVRVARLRQSPPAVAYLPYTTESIERAAFAVKTTGSPTALTAAVRRVVSGVAPDLAVDRVGTQADQIERGVARERLFAFLASALGLLALGLACIGIYGLLSYLVARRTTEIGVRLALGARPAGILLLVAGEAGRIVGLGAVLGLIAGYFASRSLQSLLFGLAPGDPAAQSVALALLATVAAFAAFVPALRAARLDPLAALRRD